MRRTAWLGFIAALAVVPVLAQADQREGASPSLAGRWFVTADYYGQPLYLRLTIEQKGDKLAGSFGRDALDGSSEGGSFHFIARTAQGVLQQVDGRLAKGVLSGQVTATTEGNPPSRFAFTAARTSERPSAPPQRHEFIPTVFYRQFSALNKPVLTVNPGDTIHTTTVDAGGTDEKGVQRIAGGNPQTGPFYVVSALPGDTLVVHLKRLRLNRDWAASDDAIVPRGLDSGLAVQMKDGGKPVRWHLDLAKGLASVEKPGEHMTTYSVPVRPMLGCIATAPNGQIPPTGDSGAFGGNMDFNEIVEGATVYLPVMVPGALLYLGDAHALQGDGEINGNALETSMDVEFTVDVIAGRIPGPRVESAAQIMAMGLAGSLDDAYRDATANMAAWLQTEHHLTPSEIAEVLGSAAEYKVSEVADRNAGIVLKISKERLAALTMPTAK
jgi:amidase